MRLDRLIPSPADAIAEIGLGAGAGALLAAAIEHLEREPAANDAPLAAKTPSPSSPAWSRRPPPTASAWSSRPSRRFVFTHLNRSLVTSSDGPNPTTTDSSNPTSSPPAPAAVFTTRHQELGTPWRGRPPPPQVLKQVWQSGERYTLDHFEAKSRAFSKTHLSGLRELTPLAVESHFWKASADRPIYIEYANDVPGSGFAAPAYSRRQKKRKRDGVPMDEGEKTAGWRLSSSP